MLKTNTVLCHLSFKECNSLTNKALAYMLDVISFYNMVLFEVQLTHEQFDETMATKLITVSRLNRAI